LVRIEGEPDAGPADDGDVGELDLGEVLGGRDVEAGVDVGLGAGRGRIEHGDPPDHVTAAVHEQRRRAGRLREQQVLGHVVPAPSNPQDPAATHEGASGEVGIATGGQRVPPEASKHAAVAPHDRVRGPAAPLDPQPRGLEPLRELGDARAVGDADAR